jgi:hypothetical protein
MKVKQGFVVIVEDSPTFFLQSFQRSQLGEQRFELIKRFVARVFHSFHFRQTSAV